MIIMIIPIIHTIMMVMIMMLISMMIIRQSITMLGRKQSLVGEHNLVTADYLEEVHHVDVDDVDDDDHEDDNDDDKDNCCVDCDYAVLKMMIMVTKMFPSDSSPIHSPEKNEKYQFFGDYYYDYDDE